MKLYRIAKDTEQPAAVPARVATLIEISHMIDVALVKTQEKLLQSGDPRYSAFLTSLTAEMAVQIQDDAKGWIWVVPAEQSSDDDDD